MSSVYRGTLSVEPLGTTWRRPDQQAYLVQILKETYDCIHICTYIVKKIWYTCTKSCIILRNIILSTVLYEKYSGTSSYSNCYKQTLVYRKVTAVSDLLLTLHVCSVCIRQPSFLNIINLKDSMRVLKYNKCNSSIRYVKY